jgi:hypothetical protein
MTALARRIRETRQALDKQDVIQPQLTDLEHQCFKDCLAILKDKIDKMSNDLVNKIPQPKFTTNMAGKGCIVHTA